MQEPDYIGYESAKRRWIANNPKHTKQGQRAMRRIAARYGV